jgi:ribosomal protein S6--L-glutamate ligase
MVKTVQDMGHEAVLIDSRNPDLTDLPEVAALIVRFSPTSQDAATEICRHYESLDIPATTTSESIRIASDKILSSQVFASTGVASPRTAELLPDTYEQLLTAGTYPLILKLPSSSQGVGVIIAESLRSARSVVDALFGLGQKVLVQEFIEADATDVRIIVVVGEVVTAMQRSGQKEAEFRSNLSAGGQGMPYQPTEPEVRLAVQAAAALGCVVAGVDIIHDAGGRPLVLEVNASPGLAIEQVTGVNIVRRYVSFLESRVTQAV